MVKNKSSYAIILINVLAFILELIVFLLMKEKSFVVAGCMGYFIGASVYSFVILQKDKLIDGLFEFGENVLKDLRIAKRKYKECLER